MKCIYFITVALLSMNTAEAVIVNGNDLGDIESTTYVLRSPKDLAFFNLNGSQLTVGDTMTCKENPNFTRDLWNQTQALTNHMLAQTAYVEPNYEGTEGLFQVGEFKSASAYHSYANSLNISSRIFFSDTDIFSTSHFKLTASELRMTNTVIKTLNPVVIYSAPSERSTLKEITLFPSSGETWYAALFLQGDIHIGENRMLNENSPFMIAGAQKIEFKFKD